MNILINCSNLRVGGGLQVAHSVLNEISSHSDHYFVIVVSSTLAELIQDISFSENHQIISYDIRPSPFAFLNGSVTFLDKLVQDQKIDRVFTLFGPSYWRPQVKHVCGFAKAQYIYKDSSFFTDISSFDRYKLKIKEFIHLQDFKNNTDVLITENEDVSKKINEKLNKPTFTVTNYYNQIFEQRQSWVLHPLPDFEGKYILTISANYPHKNLKIVPQVALQLLSRGIRDYKFVLTINKGDIPSTPIADQYIEYIGKVNINECPSLYEQSTFMLLPTLLECFSASYPEAMYMEKNILTSDLGFAHGICGDAAVYFDPLDPEDIAEKIISLGDDKERQEILRKKGLAQLKKFDDFEQRARKYLEIVTES